MDVIVIALNLYTILEINTNMIFNIDNKCMFAIQFM